MVRSWVDARRRGTPAHMAAASPAAQGAQVIQFNAGEQLPQDSLAVATVMKGVGGPLMGAVSQVASTLREQGQNVQAVDEARVFGQLVQQVVNITRTSSATLEISRDQLAPGGELMRRQVLEAVAELIGAHYRATGQLQPSGLVGQFSAAVTQIAVDGAHREDLFPSLGEGTQASLGVGLLKALPPVVHAVTRYPFGRNNLILVTEVAWELLYKSVEITRNLLTGNPTTDEWYNMFAATLHAVAEVYAEAHYAAAERMALMAPPAGGSMGELPMTDVWAAFDWQSDLLARFTSTMTGTIAAGGGRKY